MTVNFQLSYAMAGCYSSDVLSWQEGKVQKTWNNELNLGMSAESSGKSGFQRVYDMLP